MTRTPVARLGLLLTALFQLLLLPAFAAVADARAESTSERGATVHVESHGTSRCVPAHAADCALCRVLAGGATLPEGPAASAMVACIAPPLPQRAPVAIGIEALGDPSQRAPPVV